jgi:hypothetical protein
MLLPPLKRVEPVALPITVLRSPVINRPALAPTIVLFAPPENSPADAPKIVALLAVVANAPARVPMAVFELPAFVKRHIAPNPEL